LEGLAVNPEVWTKRRVFVTGHTGFKGAWLSTWLKRLGATVTGYALAPVTEPNLFELAGVAEGMTSHIADVRDLAALRSAIVRAEPEIVFHLAAQSLVRAGYCEPVDTFSVNLLGTVHVLEAIRSCSSVRAVQVITTDKVYENREWPWPYRENDPLGGYDPYAASKAAAELATASYRRSFLADAGISVASVRAGNVIGGGDWSPDRLFPDCVRAFQDGKPVVLRNPRAVRPWQHVLEPLAGYLTLAEAQREEANGRAGLEKGRFSRAFNFGPGAPGDATVGDLAALAADQWGDAARIIERPEPNAPHESGYLTLDPNLARTLLGWQTRWSAVEAVRHTVAWYRRAASGESAKALCLEQIGLYQAADRFPKDS
jgi:CDP-glucose 4,6-dehydratase